MGAAASSRPAPHQMQRLLAGPGSMAMSTSAAPEDAKKPPVPLYAAPRIWPGPAGSRSSRRRVGMPGGGKLRRRGGEAAHSRSPLRLNPRLRAHGRLQCPPCACCICCWCRGRRRDAAGDAAAGGQRVAGSGGGSGSEAAAPVPKGGPKALRPTQRCICLRSLPVAREPPWWCERRAGSGCVSRAGLGRSRAACKLRLVECARNVSRPLQLGKAKLHSWQLHPRTAFSWLASIFKRLTALSQRSITLHTRRRDPQPRLPTCNLQLAQGRRGAPHCSIPGQRLELELAAH